MFHVNHPGAENVLNNGRVSIFEDTPNNPPSASEGSSGSPTLDGNGKNKGRKRAACTSRQAAAAS